MASRRRLVFSSLGSICLLAGAVLLVSAWGERSRVAGPSALVGREPVELHFVERPEDCYLVWKRRGFRGRIVVGFSRWLNFVEFNDSALVPAYT